MKKIALALCLSALVAVPATAVARDNAVPVVLPKPTPGKGQIVIFRPSSMGFAIKCTVRENGAMIGRVGAGKYYVVEVEPGVHTLTAKSEATDTVAVQVEPDETSFVKCNIAMGMMVGRPNLSPAAQADFTSVAGKVSPMDSAKIAGEIAKDREQLAAKAAKPAG